LLRCYLELVRGLSGRHFLFGQLLLPQLRSFSPLLHSGI